MAQSFLSKGINRLLLGLIAVIAVTVIAVSAIALTEDQRPAEYRRSDPQPEEIGKIYNRSPASGRQAAFTELGQLRVPLEVQNSDGSTCTLLVTPWFAYPEEDSAFFEEISAKSRKIKAVISEYFIHKGRDELLAKGEPKIKEELLSYINGELVLGSITAVYFNEYLFID